MLNTIYGQRNAIFLSKSKDSTSTVKKNIPENQLSNNDNASNSFYNISYLNNSPNRNLSCLLESMPGILFENGLPGITENAEIGLRGGFSKGTKYIIDGIPFNNTLFGGLIGNIPQKAIDRIDCYQGGYGVEYGNALSGVINIKIRDGGDRFIGGGELGYSNLTDEYGYNKYDAYFGGPLYKGNPILNFFTAFEYLKANDNNPRSINLSIPTANINQPQLPDNESEDKRFIVKFSGKYTNFTSSLSLLGSFRKDREYIHNYSKNNSLHNPKIKENVLGGSFRLSHSNETYGNFDLNFRYFSIDYKKGDGIWFDDFEAYGDSAKNAELGVTFFNGDGDNPRTDDNGIFYRHGRIYDYFQKYNIQAWGIDFDYNFKYLIHSFRFGFTFGQSKLRYFEISPVGIAPYKNHTNDRKYYYNIGRTFGYTIYGGIYNGGDDLRILENGNPRSGTYEQVAAKKPITQSAYLEDKIKFNNLMINFGIRYDYFNPNTKRVKNMDEFLGVDGIVTSDDFEQAPSQQYFSPRIKTIFNFWKNSNIYAGLGVFRRQPDFTDIYDSWNNYENLEIGQAEFSTGYVKYEKLTQMEWGISHSFNEFGNLKAVYFQNILTDIANVALIDTKSGQSTKDFYTPINSKEEIKVKGIILNFDFWYNNIFGVSANYLYASSNMQGTELKEYYLYRLIHTKYPEWKTRQSLSLNINLQLENLYNQNSFYSLIFRNTNLSLFSIYNYDKRFSQIKYFDLRQRYIPYGFADTLTKVRNLEYFRIDLRLEKKINIGHLSIIPYLYIRNLLDRNNYNLLYVATGKPDDSGWLTTAVAQQTIMAHGKGFEPDYKALERNPANYDIPRLIRLGLKVEF